MFRIVTKKIVLGECTQARQTTSLRKQNAGFKQLRQIQKSRKPIFKYKESLSHNETITDSNSYCLRYFSHEE